MGKSDFEGSVCIDRDLGLVVVEKVLPSGACHVIDYDGRRWLVGRLIELEKVPLIFEPLSFFGD